MRNSRKNNNCKRKRNYCEQSVPSLSYSSPAREEGALGCAGVSPLLNEERLLERGGMLKADIFTRREKEGKRLCV